MEDINVLKKQLEELEKQKENKRVEGIISRMREDLGTCYVSHMIDRKRSKGYYFTAVHNVDVEVSDYYSDEDYKYRYIQEYVSVTPHIHGGIKVNIGKRSSHESQGVFMRHVITLEQFNHLKVAFRARIETTIEKIRLDFKSSDYITMGDHDNNKKSIKLFENEGIGTVDVENDLVIQTLSWENYPYLYNRKIVKGTKWLQMIMNISKQMKEHAYSWGSVIVERDRPRWEALDSFIQKHKR